MPLQWDKVYVFISSTFNDMHAERDYLVKQVFPRLQEWCERRKLRLVDIDLRWGVTEADASQNKRVVQVCLERIDACRPFFLCFLGQRRGWVPTRTDISPEAFEAYPDLEQYASHTSVTELEILHAYVNPLHRGKMSDEFARAEHAFFYLRQPDYLAALPANPPQLHAIYTNEGSTDPGKDDAELGRWRDEVIPRTGRPARAYTACWDPSESTPEIRLPLACPSTAERGSDAWQAAEERWARQWAQAGVQVDAQGQISEAAERDKADRFNAFLARGRLAEFTCEGRPLADAIMADLQAAIVARYPDHVETAALTPLQRELDQQAQFLQIAGEGFIERTGDFAELDLYAQDASLQPFFLTAPGGLGKTSLLARWIDRAQLNLKAGETLHYRFIGASDGSTTPDSLLRSLLGEIKEVAGKLEEDIPSDPDKLRAALPGLLEAAGNGGKTVLVLDGLNQLESGMGDLAWLPLALPPGVRLVASFKRGDAQAEAYYEQLRTSGCVILAKVQPFESLDDRRRLVEAYLSQFLKELDERHLETLIRSEGAGNPLYLKVVLAELRVFGAFGDLGAKIRSDFGSTPVEAFSGLLQRLESDPSYSPVRPELLVPRLFGWLAHSRTGLTVEELHGLLAREGLLPDDEAGRQRAAEAVLGLLRQLRPYLSRREGRTDFFYESFEVAVRERYDRGDGQVDAHPEGRTARDWHGSLAEYFDAQPLRLGAEQVPNQRKLAELAFQFAHAGMGARLQQTLWDYPYIEARLEGSGVEALVGDYDLANLAEAGLDAEARRPLTLLQGALRLSAHVVSYDARQLPSQLTGRLLASDQPVVNRLLDQVRKEQASPWLRPLSASLTAPGGGLVRTVTLPKRADLVAITPDGSRAVCAGPLQVVDLASGRVLFTFGAESGDIRALQILPDGERAVTGSESGRIEIWDIRHGELVRAVQAHQGEITDISIVPGGMTLVSSGEDDRVVKVWDLESGRLVRNLDLHTGQVSSVAVSPDGRCALSGSIDKTARVWDLAGVSPSSALKHSQRVFKVSFAQDNHLALTRSLDRVHVWRIPTGQRAFTFGSDKERVTQAVFTPDSSRLLVAVKKERALLEYDYDILVLDIKTRLRQRVLRGHSGEIFRLIASPDGKRAISWSEDETIRVWDLDGGGAHILRHSQTGAIARSRYLSVSADGKLVVSVRGGELRIWDLQQLAAHPESKAHQDEVTRVKVTQDGVHAITASKDHTLVVWETGTGKRLRALKGHTGAVTLLAVTKDGNTAVSGSKDNTVRVWDISTGKAKQVLKVPELSALALTPDERFIVTGGRDDIIRLWSLAGGKAVCRFVPGKDWYGVPGTPFALSFRSDGKELVVANSNRDELEMIDLSVAYRKRGPLNLRPAVYVRDIDRPGAFEDWHGRGSGRGPQSDARSPLICSQNRVSLSDAASSEKIASFWGDGSITCYALTPDERTVVAGDSAGLVHILRRDDPGKLV
jgi:WD40 repeat protein